MKTPVHLNALQENGFGYKWRLWDMNSLQYQRCAHVHSSANIKSAPSRGVHIIPGPEIGTSLLHTNCGQENKQNNSYSLNLPLPTLSKRPSTLLRRESKSKGGLKPWSTLRLLLLQRNQTVECSRLTPTAKNVQIMKPMLCSKWKHSYWKRNIHIFCYSGERFSNFI